MMFQRFTGDARGIMVRAEEEARLLGHGFLGCEHLLFAVAAADAPVGTVLRDHGVTPQAVEAEVLRRVGRGHSSDALDDLDRDALAFIGIDLDVVRARIEAAFGPDALSPGHPRAGNRRRPAWGKGPVAELRRRRRRRAGHHDPAPLQRPCGNGPSLRRQTPGDHLGFTPRAKKALALSLKEANTLHDHRVDVQHLTLALLSLHDGPVPGILSALDAPAPQLRAAILARYRRSG